MNIQAALYFLFLFIMAMWGISALIGLFTGRQQVLL